MDRISGPPADVGAARRLGPLAREHDAVERDRARRPGSRPAWGPAGRAGRRGVRDGEPKSSADEGEATAASRSIVPVAESRDGAPVPPRPPRSGAPRIPRPALLPRTPPMVLDAAELRALRKDFPPLARTRRGKPPIYLNNTCMTLRPDERDRRDHALLRRVPDLRRRAQRGGEAAQQLVPRGASRGRGRARARRCAGSSNARAASRRWSGRATRPRRSTSSRAGSRSSPATAIVTSRARAQQQPRALARGGAAAARAGEGPEARRARRRSTSAPTARSTSPQALAAITPGVKVVALGHSSNLDGTTIPDAELQRGRRRGAPGRRRAGAGRRAERAASPRGRARAGRRLPRAVAPQDVRALGHGRALRALRPARRAGALHRGRRHDPRHLARPRRVQAARRGASRRGCRTTRACSAPRRRSSYVVDRVGFEAIERARAAASTPA